MKTSNKFLIVLFLFFTLALVLFNALLNAQLKKGNIVAETREAARTSVELKPFRHVVYVGRLMQQQSRSFTSWSDYGITLSTADKYSLEIPEDMKANLDYRYDGDTLFISFSRKNIRYGRDAPSVKSLPLQLFAPGLVSISASYGNIALNGFDQKENLTLYVKNSNNAWLFDTHLPMLEVHADTSATVSITSGGVVDTLSASMKNSSFLSFYSPMNIKTILPVQSDVTSKIKVEGKANDMKEYLQKMQ